LSHSTSPLLLFLNPFFLPVPLNHFSGFHYAVFIIHIHPSLAPFSFPLPSPVPPPTAFFLQCHTNCFRSTFCIWMERCDTFLPDFGYFTLHDNLHVPLIFLKMT
jgi:hypothetical protein